MRKIELELGSRSYPVLIGQGVLDQLGDQCRSRGLRGSVAVITNSTVGPLYSHIVTTSLSSAGYSTELLEIPDGEEFKSLETFEKLLTGMISCGFDRGSFVVALGGGVVGDIAGFAASAFLRGIPVVQVPTTLLSQVDSSVGGKTGINHPLGKNLIGAFHQPSLVLIDVNTLKTLSGRDFHSGLAEVVKYGAALDETFFRYLESHVPEILAGDGSALEEVVHRSCAIKARVVEKDEQEGGIRAALNYGHTFGHAVESLTHYRQFTHGEAVAIGMAAAARISRANGFCSPDDTRRIDSLLATFGMPTQLPPYSAAEYAEALLHDKKVRDGGLWFVCNRGIGDFAFMQVSDVFSLFGPLEAGE